MVIPIYDNDPLDRNPYAFVTWTLIAINIVVFFITIGLSEDDMLVLVRDYAVIPAAVIGKLELGGSLPPFTGLFTYMFFHAGWSHIIGNMLFLWVLGDNIEDAFGSVRFFFFFMLCGVARGIAHLLSTPDSVAPRIGGCGSGLGFWALAQVWNVLSPAGGDTAWWAHIGGFVTGAVLTLVFRRPDVALFECMHPGDVMVAKAGLPGLKRRGGSGC